MSRFVTVAVTLQSLRAGASLDLFCHLIMSARFALITSLVSFAALGASTAAQAQYTIKLGGAHINPHATSEPLRGGVAVPSPLSGNLVLNDGVALQVQS